MANKNRRKQIQGYVIPVPVVSVLVVAMLLLLAYVWLDIRSKALGARIKSLEQQQAELQKKYDLELWKWEGIKSPQNIEIAWLFPQVCECGGLVNVTLNEMMHPTLIRKFAAHINEYAQTHSESTKDVYNVFKEQLLDHHVTHGQIELEDRKERENSYL